MARLCLRIRDPPPNKKTLCFWVLFKQPTKGSIKRCCLWVSPGASRSQKILDSSVRGLSSSEVVEGDGVGGEQFEDWGHSMCALGSSGVRWGGGGLMKWACLKKCVHAKSGLGKPRELQPNRVSLQQEATK